MEFKNRTCPRCGKKYYEYPSISRRDNKTEICPDCGVIEALKDYFNSKNNKTNKDKNE